LIGVRVVVLLKYIKQKIIKLLQVIVRVAAALDLVGRLSHLLLVII